MRSRGKLGYIHINLHSSGSLCKSCRADLLVLGIDEIRARGRTRTLSDCTCCNQQSKDRTKSRMFMVYAPQRNAMKNESFLDGIRPPLETGMRGLGGEASLISLKRPRRSH